MDLQKAIDKALKKGKDFNASAWASEATFKMLVRTNPAYKNRVRVLKEYDHLAYK